MNHDFFFWWFGATWLFVLLAGYCENVQRSTRGVGSWLRDREFQALRGAFYAFAIVTFALSLACLFFP